MSDPTDTTLPVEFLGTMTAMLGSETPMITGPSGTIITATVTSATFAGPKVNATAPAGVAAADWPLVRADGTIVLDVRANMRTDDGVDIFITYNGIGVPRDGGGYDIRTAPLFQTGDERYAWLNNVQAVGIGGTIDGGVEYQIYAVK
jgi:hypothetical protein